MDLSLLTAPDTYISLATLTAMEIVFGIDNVVFISLLTSKLPEGQRPLARSLGLSLALLSRIALLLTVFWAMGSTRPLFELFGETFSVRNLISIAGGAFLVSKATLEIHRKLEGDGGSSERTGSAAMSFGGVLAQILVLDVVFSLDSVMIAVGMAEHLPVMITAMVIAACVMLLSVGAISEFVERHPTLKVLALCFLFVIGVMLVAEGMGQQIRKGYLYAAMAFALAVELLNMMLRRRTLERADDPADEVEETESTPRSSQPPEDRAQGM